MTVNATTPKIAYDYNGVGDYNFNFKIFTENDIVVKYIVNGETTILTLTTDYSVTITDTDAGTGYITTVETSTDGTLEIYRVLDIIQSTQWPTGGDFDEELLETALDKIVMIVQQLEVTVEEGAAITSWRGDWTTLEEYSIKDLVSDTVTNNLYYCVVAHTAGTFSTDLAAGYWELVFDASTISGVSSVTATSPLTSSGGTTPDISFVPGSEPLVDSDFTANGAIERTGAGAYTTILNKRDATAAPTVDDDTGEGYVVGSRWIDVTNDKEYVCLDNSSGAAVWIETTYDHIDPPSGVELTGGIYGMGFESDTDAEHDILIAAGSCWDSTKTSHISLSTGITKQIDATWAVGDDAGGLLNGTVAANTWYHIYALLKDSDYSVDFGFLADGDAIGTYLPSGYSRYRRIGLIYTNSSSNIASFIFRDTCLEFLKASEAIFATGLTATSYTSLGLSSLIPQAVVETILPGGQTSTGSTLSMHFSIDGTNTAFGLSSISTYTGDTSIGPWTYSQDYGRRHVSTKDDLYYKVSSGTWSFLIQQLRLVR
ncbi:MAG: hypothetical protein PVG39_00805 [Desulfobacteraceae bacterium]|jgi:hypothetical protein